MAAKNAPCNRIASSAGLASALRRQSIVFLFRFSASSFPSRFLFKSFSSAG
jgi:hypothetical protein